ncbi:glutathione S-transferase T3-like [Salvia miltiorrhiza]|uniref:glutathione S-transferase T3-like n=1 Tax=Salvia miltiorrhiza TaxID=226208 RepID=UPI0025AD224D|nr:glutathione S-transferase T3-like [Salvia miltiorrhiza]
MDREFDEYLEQQGGTRLRMMGFAPFSQASNVLATGNVPTPTANANVQEEPEEVKPKAKGTRAAYSSEESELVAILWAEATHNPVLGTSQKLLQYWGAIVEKFNALNTSGAPPRKPDHLKSHFARVQKETKFFEGFYNTCKDNWGSGMSDDQIFQQAQTMFEANFKKQFSYVKAWKVLRECQIFTSQAGDVHSAKKSKGSDGGATTTSLEPSVTARPQGQKAAKRDKGKAKKGEGSSGGGSTFSDALEKVAESMREHALKTGEIAEVGPTPKTPL